MKFYCQWNDLNVGKIYHNYLYSKIISWYYTNIKSINKLEFNYDPLAQKYALMPNFSIKSLPGLKISDSLNKWGSLAYMLSLKSWEWMKLHKVLNKCLWVWWINE